MMTRHHAQGAVARNITYEDLVKLFHLPLKEAAQHLEICCTSLKKICRRLGVTRWPYRKLRSMDRSIGQQIRDSPLYDSPQELLLIATSDCHDATSSSDSGRRRNRKYGAESLQQVRRTIEKRRKNAAGNMRATVDDPNMKRLLEQLYCAMEANEPSPQPKHSPSPSLSLSASSVSTSDSEKVEKDTPKPRRSSFSTARRRPVSLPGHSPLRASFHQSPDSVHVSTTLSELSLRLESMEDEEYPLKHSLNVMQLEPPAGPLPSPALSSGTRSSFSFIDSPADPADVARQSSFGSTADSSFFFPELDQTDWLSMLTGGDSGSVPSLAGSGSTIDWDQWSCSSASLAQDFVLPATPDSLDTCSFLPIERTSDSTVQASTLFRSSPEQPRMPQPSQNNVFAFMETQPTPPPRMASNCPVSFGFGEATSLPLWDSFLK